jgi:hypothetical protein
VLFLDSSFKTTYTYYNRRRAFALMLTANSSPARLPFSGRLNESNQSPMNPNPFGLESRQKFIAKFDARRLFLNLTAITSHHRTYISRSVSFSHFTLSITLLLLLSFLCFSSLSKDEKSISSIGLVAC